MLSERQRLILSAIVDDYIRSAEPVGSRSISKRGGVTFSPATIRNEMADLEELGLLEQPHTSAGRVPSNKGYRYYVDHLVTLGGVGEGDVRKIRTFFAEQMNHWEGVIGQAATMLSSLTNYTSIVLGPEMFSTSLKHFQLVPLSDSSAVAIIVANTGHVEHRTMTIPEGIAMDDLQRVVNMLNDKLAGVPFYRVKAVLHAEIASELSRYVDRCEQLLDMLEETLSGQHDPKMYMSGAAHMLGQPEFRDADKAKPILNALEETSKLLQLFQSAPGGIQVRIGTENALEAINACSLITASYSIEGKPIGTIGIIGPTRMEYGKVISLLGFLAKDLETVMAKWYK